MSEDSVKCQDDIRVKIQGAHVQIMSDFSLVILEQKFYMSLKLCYFRDTGCQGSIRKKKFFFQFIFLVIKYLFS